MKDPLEDFLNIKIYTFDRIPHMQVASSPANFDIELSDGLVSLESEQQNGVVDDPTKAGLVCASEGKFHTKYVTPPRMAKISELKSILLK